MRIMFRFLLASMAMCGVAGLAHGQSGCIFPRADQVHPAVSVVVTKIDARFTYSYTLAVLPDSPKPVAEFWVPASPTDTTATLNTPAAWWGLTSPIGYYAWAARNPIQGLAQGGSLGFGVTSVDLPTIVTFVAVNDVEPPKFPEGHAPDDCQGASVLDNSFKGSTIGPKAPPSTDRVQLVNYLISLVHDARRLNWIKRDGAQQSLLAKLINAKRKLEQGDVATAKSSLSSFVNEVEATSCDDFSCHGNKPSTSEAYALLKFNAEYLIAQIP